MSSTLDGSKYLRVLARSDTCDGKYTANAVYLPAAKTLGDVLRGSS